jgi:uncharacterized protein (DUF1501 family)
MHRRTFLKGLGLGAGALAAPSLLPRIAAAAEGKDHYFVFVYFEGGWDILLSLDPRDPAVFTDDVLLETGIQPAYDRIFGGFPTAPIDLGPYTVGPCAGDLASVANDFTVFRGVNMSTLTHEVGRRHFLTGRPPSGLQARGPSVGSLAVSQIGADRPIPHMAVAMEAYNDTLPPFASALPVALVQQLRFTLQSNFGMGTPGISSAVKGALAAYRKRPPSQGPTAGAASSALAQVYIENRERAAELVASGLHDQFDFASPALAGLRSQYGFDEATVESPAGRAALAAQALKTGLCRVVSVTLAAGLDTHDNDWSFGHPTQLAAGFKALADLVADLKASEAPGGGSLWSKTTVCVFSEFARTPVLNSQGGRDHHFGNCAMLGGAGVVGGRTFGQSSDKALEPEYVDLTTGLPSGNGETLLPEHVLATALAAGKLDYSELRVEPLQTLLQS